MNQLPPPAAEISVVVVNYGTADLAIAAVESVLDRRHGGRRVDVHLLDNASPGDDARRFAAAHAERGWGDRVTLYPETTNHGFGRGNNVVLQALARRPQPPEKVFLLNPDARLENEAIDILAGVLDSHPEIGLAGAHISKPGNRPVTAAFRFPSLQSEVARAVGFGPLTRLLGRWTVALPPDRPTGPVDWVAGAAVMFRFRAIAEAGFFDPDYFLYYEEVDLMRRMARADWTAWFVAEARVVHEEGAATEVRSHEAVRRRRPDYWYESWRLYFWKIHGRPYALVTALLVWLGAVLNHAISRLRRQLPGLPLRFLSDQARLVMRPLLTGSAPRRPAVAPARASGPGGKPARNDGTVNRNPSGIGFWALVAEDYRTHYRDPFAQGFWALFWHRFGNWRMSVRPKLLRAPLTILYRAMAKVCEWVCGIFLPYTVVVGRRVRLEHFGGMILVAEAIGDDVVIRQNTTFGVSRLDALQSRPVIGDRVEIGAGAVIVGAIEVGDDAVVGANAVVTRPVPPGAVVGGVPARILREGPRREAPAALTRQPATVGDA